MCQYEDRCHNSMRSYVNIVSKSAYYYNGSNVPFLGVLSTHVVAGLWAHLLDLLVTDVDLLSQFLDRVQLEIDPAVLIARIPDHMLIPELKAKVQRILQVQKCYVSNFHEGVVSAHQTDVGTLLRRLHQVIIETRNYHMIGMYFTTKHLHQSAITCV